VSSNEFHDALLVTNSHVFYRLHNNIFIVFLQHHWSDVSAGALIGAVAASLTARYVSHLIKGPGSSNYLEGSNSICHDLNNMESGTQSALTTEGGSNVRTAITIGKRPSSQHQQQSVANPRSSYDSSAVLR